MIAPILRFLRYETRQFKIILYYCYYYALAQEYTFINYDEEKIS